MPFTPRFKGNVTARYTWDMMDWKAHVQASVLFQTGDYSALKVADIAALGTMPGYASADFSIGADRGKTSFEVFVKNATDTRGQTNRFSPCTQCEIPLSSGSVRPRCRPRPPSMSAPSRL